MITKKTSYLKLSLLALLLTCAAPSYSSEDEDKLPPPPPKEESSKVPSFVVEKRLGTLLMNYAPTLKLSSKDLKNFAQYLLSNEKQPSFPVIGSEEGIDMQEEKKSLIQPEKSHEEISQNVKKFGKLMGSDPTQDVELKKKIELRKKMELQREDWEERKKKMGKTLEGDFNPEDTIKDMKKREEILKNIQKKKETPQNKFLN
jgi:hypothetical protein